MISFYCRLFLLLMVGCHTATNCNLVILAICGSRTLCWTLAAFSVSWSFTQSVGILGRGISPSQSLYLHRINTQTSMLLAGFEPTIPVFELAKTVHALDRAATVNLVILSWMKVCIGTEYCKEIRIIPTDWRAHARTWCYCKPALKDTSCRLLV
jgi:hypothetical protein